MSDERDLYDQIDELRRRADELERLVSATLRERWRTGRARDRALDLWDRGKTADNIAKRFRGASKGKVLGIVYRARKSGDPRAAPHGRGR